MSDRIPAAKVRLKRAYAPADASDGLRVLVDRLWPRGLSKSEAALDEWMKDIAPSDALRNWFGHDPSRWDEFGRRYEAELKDKSALLRRLRSLCRQGPVTLVYAAHDEAHNNARVLRDVVLGRRRARA